MTMADYRFSDWLRSSTHNCLLLLALALSSASGEVLEYRASPIDNPLKGFVPYAGQENHRFPHSLEFRYFALKDILVGETAEGGYQFDWSPIEGFLDEVKSRGNQGVFRIHCEYPRDRSEAKIGIPQFLVKRGVRVSRVRSTKALDAGGSPTHCSVSPDYENPVLRRALAETITAMGARYDGDPRIGFIELGTLGFWGEWHTYPQKEHMASCGVQQEVLQSFEDAFKTTKLLARYPEDDPQSGAAPNAARNVGYHDDSFTWSTVYKCDASWHFLTRMANSNASHKWKTNPIGGELYPQLNASVFKDVCEHEGRIASDFKRTVEDTHASYMRLEAVFEKDLSNRRRARAELAALRMGYDLHFRKATVTSDGTTIRVTAILENRGVAPFYYNWPAYVGVLNSAGQTVGEWTADWRIDGLVADEDRKFRVTLTPTSPIPADAHVAVRVPNPMEGGRSLRFSNKTQQLDGQHWMVLGDIAVSEESSSSTSVSLAVTTTGHREKTTSDTNE